jgi:hypothetical protein
LYLWIFSNVINFTFYNKTRKPINGNFFGHENESKTEFFLLGFGVLFDEQSQFVGVHFDNYTRFECSFVWIFGLAHVPDFTGDNH